MKFISFVVTFALLGSAAHAWDRGLWDPGEISDDQLELELPCGGKMAFVRVTTPVEPGDPLSDREIKIGSTEASTGYLDFFRKDHVRGGFNQRNKAFYYLAKYEVTRDQWDAVMGECPEPTPGGSRPQGGLTWFDGIEFTRVLSEWINAEHPDMLPIEDGVRGHMRLPTEAEWEYAARGGAAVEFEEFRSAMPPIDGEMGDYAWFAGRNSSNGSFRPIGRKLANPLGLHDMLGSVEELTLEPFRLNNLGRLHGQVGGFVTRGGSIDSDEFELSSAARTEWPFFDPETGGATSEESIGLRPVVSVQVNTSLVRSTQIQDLWKERWSSDPSVEDDPLTILDNLSDRTTDKQLLEELAYIRGEVLNDRRAREEAASQSMRLSLLNGATLRKWVRSGGRSVTRREQVLNVYREQLEDARNDGNTALVTRLQTILDREQAKLVSSREDYALASSIYLETLIRLAESDKVDELAAQKDLLILELAERNQEGLSLQLERFHDAIIRRRDDPSTSSDDLLGDAINE